MQLYMKQKVFSWKDRFNIMDSMGETRYYVEGKAISLGKKLRVFDANNRELAFVNQKVWSLMPTFIVEIEGSQAAVIRKKLSFLKPKYVIDGPDWEVQGDFLGHDYQITENGKPIVAIHKKWMSWGDTFEIDVAEGSNEVLTVAVVLAIDAVMDSQSSSSSVAFDSNNN